MANEEQQWWYKMLMAREELAFQKYLVFLIYRRLPHVHISTVWARRTRQWNEILTFFYPVPPSSNYLLELSILSYHNVYFFCQKPVWNALQQFAGNYDLLHMHQERMFLGSTTNLLKMTKKKSIMGKLLKTTHNQKSPIFWTLNGLVFTNNGC